MEQDENGEISGKLLAANKACPSFLPTTNSALTVPLCPTEAAENTAVLHHLVKLAALQARVQIQQQNTTEAILTAVEKLAAKIVQASHVKFWFSEKCHTPDCGNMLLICCGCHPPKVDAC